jgi:hypothetical protein
MFRTLSIGLIVILAGCVSTPNTKALITPLGGVGIHSFAPRTDPDRLPPLDADVTARVAANQRDCGDDKACTRHE